ncbi:uncharacterized protein LAJ45_04001 [Morchella importuna]|uniref:Roadblock/LAMTOR2 domain-containing protein n=1 Tax=Morchella conica CCBAS932 TaxID=1392247 RepID=A0A3N4LF28_9PEZI|nr:uncharacterized protein LAJ45_04001 [Morchella importuna]KAH8152008.1 hypothetical protein LAJ45_04001 [Morchella importuna]RPB16555.1 hypothetical protein P167DRAFT_541897 [Morchella conica CCBAS932]
MLKTKPLNQLLSQSISPNVSSALLFTPTGSLLATGTSPTAPDARKSRTYSALAANIWSAYDRVAVQGVIEQSLPAPSDDTAAVVAAAAAAPTPGGGAAGGPSGQGLKSLTLELSDYNLHIQVVVPGVLLCLIGPKQPTRHNSSSSSLHSQEGEAAATGSVPRSGGGGGAGSASVGSSVAGSGSLGILKTQAQALVAYLETELLGFELPEGI